jgi:hypothetical protein
MSSSGDCTCAAQCPRDEKCACIFVYEGEEGDEGECNCECAMTFHRPTPYRPRVLPVSARVAISTDGVDLARLATFLDKQCEVDVLVPEGRQDETVSLNMRDSRLADVIEAAGLTIRGSGPSATGSGY